MKARVNELLHAALILLEDGCPPDAGAYYCRHAEDADETICSRCWDRYLHCLANGEDPAADAARMTRGCVLE